MEIPENAVTLQSIGQRNKGHMSRARCILRSRLVHDPRFKNNAPRVAAEGDNIYVWAENIGQEDIRQVVDEVLERERDDRYFKVVNHQPVSSPEKETEDGGFAEKVLPDKHMGGPVAAQGYEYEIVRLTEKLERSRVLIAALQNEKQKITHENQELLNSRSEAEEVAYKLMEAQSETAKSLPKTVLSYVAAQKEKFKRAEEILTEDLLNIKGDSLESIVSGLAEFGIEPASRDYKSVGDSIAHDSDILLSPQRLGLLYDEKNKGKKESLRAELSERNRQLSQAQSFQRSLEGTVKRPAIDQSIQKIVKNLQGEVNETESKLKGYEQEKESFVKRAQAEIGKVKEEFQKLDKFAQTQQIIKEEGLCKIPLAILVGENSSQYTISVYLPTETNPSSPLATKVLSEHVLGEAVNRKSKSVSMDQGYDNENKLWYCRLNFGKDHFDQDKFLGVLQSLQRSTIDGLQYTGLNQWGITLETLIVQQLERNLKAVQKPEREQEKKQEDNDSNVQDSSRARDYDKRKAAYLELVKKNPGIATNHLYEQAQQLVGRTFHRVSYSRDLRELVAEGLIRKEGPDRKPIFYPAAVGDTKAVSPATERDNGNLLNSMVEILKEHVSGIYPAQLKSAIEKREGRKYHPSTVYGGINNLIESGAAERLEKTPGNGSSGARKIKLRSE